MQEFSIWAIPSQILGKVPSASQYLNPKRDLPKETPLPCALQDRAAYFYSRCSAGIAINQTAPVHLPVKMDFQIYRTLVLREVNMGNTVPPSGEVTLPQRPLY